VWDKSFKFSKVHLLFPAHKVVLHVFWQGDNTSLNATLLTLHIWWHSKHCGLKSVVANWSLISITISHVTVQAVLHLSLFSPMGNSEQSWWHF
jgi:hypothetical protein